MVGCCAPVQIQRVRGQKGTLTMPEAEKPLPGGARRVFTTEQKLAILQQWHEGIPVTHICRQHALNSKVFYRWKKQLDKGFSDRQPTETVPKAKAVQLERRIEELERALGRKALEVDILKKAFELRGLRLPEGI